jgi:hypothetical protein
MAMLGLDPEPGSLREWRRRERLRARLAGQGPPTHRQLAPLYVALVVAVAIALLLEEWARTLAGLPGVVMVGVAYLALLVRLVRWRADVVRRRRGRYTVAEAARVTQAALPSVLLHVLRRDGFRVERVDYEGVPRLFGVDWHGREVDCVVREGSQGVDTLGGAPRTATLRAAGQPAIDETLRLVVSLGGYARGDVLWASRQGGVHLIDGRMLRTWVAGEPLPKLIGTAPRPERRRDAV